MADGDGLVRAMTDDGGLRVIVTRTTEMVRAAAAAQRVRGPLAARFGELLTATVLVRETMAPRLRVQGLVRGSDGKGLLVADSHPDGTTRGLVRIPEGRTTIPVEGGALLQLMRTLPNGELHTGTVEVPPDGGLGAAFMGYMLDSEQVATAIAVGCSMDGDEVRAAGGYVVQLLPELDDATLAIMTARLEEFPSMETLLGTTELTTNELLGELLFRMAHTRLEERRVAFGCTCSVERLLASLATIGRADLESLVTSADPLDITCDYCRTPYQILPEQLRGLLTTS